MLNVMCRPELHDATTREQYDAFHAEMDQLGLEQTITRDGKVFRLPTGVYLGLNLSAHLDLLSIQITLSAMKITGYVCKLMLTPIANPDDIRILGLEEITPSYRGLFGALLSTPPVSPFDAFWGNKPL